MLKTNFVLEKLRSGTTVLGSWSVMPSAIVADVISSAGLDFLIIDSEHGPVNFQSAQEMAIACESRGVSPIMRVPAAEHDILRALDIGMHGIQVPNISSAQMLAEVVKNAKFPPQGERGLSPFTRVGNYSLESVSSLTSSANQNTLLAINIEGQEALDNLDQILAEPALDVVYIGLFDISKAFGIPGQVTDPRVRKCLAEVASKVSKAGKWPGTIATSPTHINEFFELGIKYLAYLVDCEMLRSSYCQIRKHFDALARR